MDWIRKCLTVFHELFILLGGCFELYYVRAFVVLSSFGRHALRWLYGGMQYIGIQCHLDLCDSLMTSHGNFWSVGDHTLLKHTLWACTEKLWDIIYFKNKTTTNFTLVVAPIRKPFSQSNSTTNTHKTSQKPAPYNSLLFSTTSLWVKTSALSASCGWLSSNSGLFFEGCSDVWHRAFDPHSKKYKLIFTLGFLASWKKTNRPNPTCSQTQPTQPSNPSPKPRKLPNPSVP